MQQLGRLAEETDEDPASRIMSLRAERDRIDQELKELESGHVKTIDEATALERTRGIIALATDLIGDFRKVRADFEDLHRDLRVELVGDEHLRGPVLKSLFAGVDVISESDSGRTFAAFWRLLTDPKQGSMLENSLESMTSRDFWKK